VWEAFEKRKREMELREFQGIHDEPDVEDVARARLLTPPIDLVWPFLGLSAEEARERRAAMVARDLPEAPAVEVLLWRDDPRRSVKANTKGLNDLLTMKAQEGWQFVAAMPCFDDSAESHRLVFRKG
jgi:hypothetical protein